MQEVYKQTKRDMDMLSYLILFTIFLYIAYSLYTSDRYYLILSGLMLSQLIWTNRIRKKAEHNLKVIELENFLRGK